MARRQRAFQAARHRGRGLRAPAPPRRGAVGDPPTPWPTPAAAGASSPGEGHQREYQRTAVGVSPEGTDFSKVSGAEVERAYGLIKDRPRKVLGHRTANEVYRGMFRLV